MFDHGSDEPIAALAPAGQRLAASLTQLAEVTGVLAGLSFAEFSEQTVKDALVALDGCRNRLDAAWVHALGVFDGQAMWAGDGDRPSTHLTRSVATSRACSPRPKVCGLIRPR